MKPSRLLPFPLFFAFLVSAFIAPTFAEEPKAPHAAIDPQPKKDDGWQKRHAAINENVKKTPDTQLLLIGDSITQGWGGAGKEAWAKHYTPRKAVNLGIGGDRTQHVLWRLDNGNLEGIKPKAAVVMIGTNNSGNDSAEQIAEGITAIVTKLRTKLPDTKILVLGVFPRGEKPNKTREKLDEVNKTVAKLDDGRHIFYLDIGASLMNPDGTILKEIMPDFLHLSPKGYEIWATAIEPKLTEWLGALPPETAKPSGPAVEDPAKPARRVREYGWMPVKNWNERHEKYLARAKKGKIDLLFLGDSITEGWGDNAVWRKHYMTRSAANFGIGGDTTQNVLWRITNGEIDGIAPKLVVLMIGTNNFGLHNDKPEDVARGVTAVVSTLREKLPRAKILLLGMFPRDEKPDTDFRKRIGAANAIIAKLDDGKHVHYMDLSGKFLAADGKLTPDIMPDYLHLSQKGYEIWADAMEAKVKELMGE